MPGGGRLGNALTLLLGGTAATPPSLPQQIVCLVCSESAGLGVRTPEGDHQPARGKYIPLHILGEVSHLTPESEMQVMEGTHLTPESEMQVMEVSVAALGGPLLHNWSICMPTLHMDVVEHMLLTTAIIHKTCQINQ